MSWRGILPKILGGGVPHGSQNFDPISDQNIWMRKSWLASQCHPPPQPGLQSVLVDDDISNCRKNRLSLVGLGGGGGGVALGPWTNNFSPYKQGLRYKNIIIANLCQLSRNLIQKTACQDLNLHNFCSILYNWTLTWTLTQIREPLSCRCCVRPGFECWNLCISCSVSESAVFWEGSWGNKSADFIFLCSFSFLQCDKGLMWYTSKSTNWLCTPLNLLTATKNLFAKFIYWLITPKYVTGILWWTLQPQHSTNMQQGRHSEHKKTPS